jgi:hypothetical protein
MIPSGHRDMPVTSPTSAAFPKPGTFLDNHLSQLVSIDFFTVPCASGKPA